MYIDQDPRGDSETEIALMIVQGLKAACVLAFGLTVFVAVIVVAIVYFLP
jgi:hypothetical protein